LIMKQFYITVFKSQKVYHPEIKKKLYRYK
jgi:hypothetical protein